MSNTYDAADKLNIQAMPIPTEQRQDVFCCEGLSKEALERWERQAGTSSFWSPSACFIKCLVPAEFCGVALFVVACDGWLSIATSELLQPFYDRAGSEANVFQWQPIEKNFVRRDVHWFNERKT